MRSKAPDHVPGLKPAKVPAGGPDFFLVLCFCASAHPLSYVVQACLCSNVPKCVGNIVHRGRATDDVQKHLVAMRREHLASESAPVFEGVQEMRDSCPGCPTETLEPALPGELLVHLLTRSLR